MSAQFDDIFEEARRNVRATTLELAELEKLCVAVMQVVMDRNEDLMARVRELENLVSAAERMLRHTPACPGDNFLSSLANLEHGYRQLEAELAKLKGST